ncbi:LpqB family beta-propeller domain-containing protein, partial [Corynebacterium sp.]|uniref:LpqB family beta-propeller domain-containing protein n=1 Tax=Corynebacterium sp. TaxID=1720 RepID=UPI0025BBBAFD
MTRADGMRQVGALLTAAVTAGGLIACTTLPGESTPEAVSSYVSAPDVGNLPTPSEGQPPDLLLRDFYLASTSQANNRQAAKEFLTKKAAGDWQDSVSTLILDRLDLNATGGASGDEVTYVVRGTVVGRLGTGGVYQTENSPYEEEVTLSRGSDGWRITDLPDGVILDRSDFVGSYQAHDLYFLDPTKRFLVPDRRWIYNRQDNIGFSLVSLLAGGPRNQLQDAVETEFPTGNGVQAAVEGDGTFTVDISGIADLPVDDREVLAAQLVWTLAASDVRGPYRILADGTSVTDDGREDWTLADVADFDPQAGNDEPLRALRDGALVEVEGSSGVVMSGWTASGQLESAASAGPYGEARGRVAAVSGRGDGERSLLVGDVGGDPVTALTARSLSRPSWSGDGQNLYVVADGRRVHRLESAGSGVQMDESTVDTSALDSLDISDPRISVFTVSRDGTRAAMLINGRLFISALQHGGDGGESVSLGTPMEVGQRVGDTALSVDWRDDGTLLVGTRANDAPVWVVTADGSEATQLSSRNITAPVVAVGSAGSVQYILDSRAMLQLDVQDSEARFWREVPALQG